VAVRELKVMTAASYRDLVLDCLKWAARTRPGRNREILLELAKDWHKAAITQELDSYAGTAAGTEAIPPKDLA
jgi:hypothetical protein